LAARKLADVSGLSAGEDPLHLYLTWADECLQSERNWNEIHRFQVRNSKDYLELELFKKCGHPMSTDATPERIEKFRNWLKDRGETILANLIDGLRRKMSHLGNLPDENLLPTALLLTMMFIIGNLDLMKEEDPRKYRSIDDEWE